MNPQQRLTANESGEKGWTKEAKQNLAQLDEEHPRLFDVSNAPYHNRLEKQKARRETDSSPQEPGEQA